MNEPLAIITLPTPIEHDKNGKAKPSVYNTNTVVTAAFRNVGYAQGIKNKAKKGAYDAVTDWLKTHSDLRHVKGFRVVAHVHYRNDQRRDIHNLNIKPIFDTFTKEGLWQDDSLVVEWTVTRAGNDETNPRVEFWIYEETAA